MNLESAIQFYAYGTSEGAHKGWETRPRASEQTRREFILQRMKETPLYSRMSTAARVSIIHQALKEHERAIKDAVAHGQRVSWEVLREYPGIVIGKGLGSLPGHYFASALQAALKEGRVVLEHLQLPRGLNRKTAFGLAAKRAKNDFRGFKYDPDTGRAVCASALTNTLARDPTQVPHWDDLKEEGYKKAMKRQYSRTPLHTQPGTMPLQSIQGVVEKRNGKWHVFSEDRKKHLGGPYGSEEQATHRLKQIDYFKHRDAA